MLQPADDKFIASLAAKLPADTLRDADSKYLEEPRGRYQGQAGPVALPRNTQEVSVIMAACHAASVGVVPFGGGTSLVGGQVMPAGPVPLILSLERMNAVRGISALENTITVEAGAVLANVQAAAADVDRLFPLSLASEGSCQIGGNLATNAGGLNVLRYGNTRDLCLGIEAVLPDGKIMNTLTRLRKDNTGYDIKNLLIGAEGSLGIITAATLRLFPVPRSVAMGIFVVRDPDAALSVLNAAQSIAGGEVSAFELIHRVGLEFLAEAVPDVRQPFDEMPSWCVLIEIGRAAEQGAEAALEMIFTQGFEAGDISDGIIAQSEAQRAALWSVRERIPEANRIIGSVASHDVSLPLSHLSAFISETSDKIAQTSDVRLNVFGHVGDGNLHFNLFPALGKKRDAYGAVRADLSALVHDQVAKFEGSFSAEHGVGRMKTGELERYADPGKMAAIRAVKQALDPKGIMNPGVITA